MPWRTAIASSGPGRAVLVIVLLAVGYLCCLLGLGDTGLVDETEPIFAETARQMLETGDVVTPVFNGATRFDKPPLVYWLDAAVYGVAGVSEWAARLPSALSALAVAAMIGATVLYLSPSGLGAAARWGGAFVAVLSFLMSPGTLNASCGTVSPACERTP